MTAYLCRYVTFLVLWGIISNIVGAVMVLPCSMNALKGKYVAIIKPQGAPKHVVNVRNEYSKYVA